MIVMNINIPEAAITAGESALKGEFRLDDVREAVAGVLYDLYHTGGDHSQFDYGSANKDVLHDRIADRLMQSAKRKGLINHLGAGRWKALPSD